MVVDEKARAFVKTSRGRSNSPQRKVATLGKHHLSSALFGLNFKFWSRNTQLQVIVHGAGSPPPFPVWTQFLDVQKHLVTAILSVAVFYVFLIQTIFTYF